MKCFKCFFSTTIGAGIYADYPVKYCKLSHVTLSDIIALIKVFLSKDKELCFTKPEGEE